MERRAANWLKIAKYDLKTAEVAFDNKLYLKVYENSHSALEKLLKGIISSQGKDSEKIHDLLRLVSQALIENLQTEVREILDELNTVYFSARYPEDFDFMEENFGEDRARRLLGEVKRIFAWLEKKLK